MNKFLFTVFIFYIFLYLPKIQVLVLAGSQKSNSQEKVKEIENMYRDGFLSKTNVLKLKKNTKNLNFSKTNCDSIKVKRIILLRKI